MSNLRRLAFNAESPMSSRECSVTAVRNIPPCPPVPLVKHDALQIVSLTLPMSHGSGVKHVVQRRINSCSTQLKS